MPIYEYVILNDDGSEGDTFEVLQKISEPTLKKHPTTGQKVMRILSAFSARKPAGGPITGDTSTKNLDRLGFTKYQKTKTGTYEKLCGDGPDLIKKGPE